MKKVQKSIVSVVLAFVLVFLNGSAQVIAVVSSDSVSSELTEAKDYIAGIVKNNSSDIVLTSSSQLLQNGVYYINNKYDGLYIRYSSSLSLTSGLINQLGNSIRWQLNYVNGNYTIRSTADSTKYLGVPTDTSSATVEVVTVSTSSVPTRCLWNITIASGSNEGGLIKNTYNSKYLYSAGSVMYTSATLGSSGSSTYYSRVWRVISQADMVGRELQSGFTVDTCYLLTGESGSPTINPTPTNAVWTSPSDFSYSGIDMGYFVFRRTTGQFSVVYTGSGLYTTTLTAVHRVTGRTASFTLVINPSAVLVGIPDPSPGHDHVSSLNTIRSDILSCGYSCESVNHRNLTVNEMDNFLDTCSVFVSRSHGGLVINTTGTQIGTYISLNSDDSVTYMSIGSINNLDLSNMKLVVFGACHTGEGGETAPNLPSVAVSRGAQAAIGFQGLINCDDTNTWIRTAFDLLQEGRNIYYVVNFLKDQYQNTPLANVTLCGNTSVKLKLLTNE